MKIERLSDNKVRCTLTKGDLLERHLTLSKLMSGSEEARQLLREVMDRCFEEEEIGLGDHPIMVEAAGPVDGGLVLTFTLMDKQEEGGQSEAKAKADMLSRSLAEHLASRLARKQQEAASASKGNQENKTEKSGNAGNKAENTGEEKKASQNKKEAEVPVAIFSFFRKEDLLALSRLNAPAAGIRSDLYFQPRTKVYYLVLTAPEARMTQLLQLSCRLSEFGRRVKATEASSAYYAEHCRVLCRRNALKELREGKDLTAEPEEKEGKQEKQQDRC